jgi:NAD(P)-dependent dehydrogenase (short-subunit alcohol dehydrogenase family)
VAIDFARHSIRCNAVCPGSVQTPMLNNDVLLRLFLESSVPLGRYAPTEEVAAA